MFLSETTHWLYRLQIAFEISNIYCVTMNTNCSDTCIDKASQANPKKPFSIFKNK